MKSFIFVVGVVAMLCMAVPAVRAQANPSCSSAGFGYGFTYYPCTPGLVRVYLQVNTFGYGVASQPSNFTVVVSPRNAAPVSFQGSAQGTVVHVAGSYTIAASLVSGYSSHYSLGCNGTVSNGEEVTCIITQNAYAPYGATYPYYLGGTTYTYGQNLNDLPPTVTLAQESVPALPNTGFGPLLSPLVALCMAVLAGLGLLVLPYVRKIIATIG